MRSIIISLTEYKKLIKLEAENKELKKTSY